MRWERRRRVRRRRAARRIAAMLLVVFVLGTLGVALGRHVRLAERSAGVVVATPPGHVVWRSTAWLHTGQTWHAADLQRVARIADRMLADPALPPRSALVIMDGRDGRLLYARNPDVALVPGSTMKILTGLAALATLGPTYRFVTQVVTDGRQVGTMLEGNLWLVGGGDPELTTADLRRAIASLRARGIRLIHGDVGVDATRYGPAVANPTWDPDDLQYGWAAPASGLSLNGGSLEVTIVPRADEPARVAVDPPGQRVEGRVMTVAPDAANTLTIDSSQGGKAYVVRGGIPLGAPQTYWRTLWHPTRAAAAALGVLLRHAGIAVQGRVVASRAPHLDAVLWRHQSRPLDALLKHMFCVSDNHYAEQLLREIGYRTSGSGTWSASLAAERSVLAGAGVPLVGVRIADGSGLSPDNRLTARALGDALVRLLDMPLPEPPYRLLPRAGLEGTVAVRSLAPTALGRVFAKDGYVDGASTLGGYVLTAHHGPVIFAFLVNNWQFGLDRVWAAEDRALDELAAL